MLKIKKDKFVKNAVIPKTQSDYKKEDILGVIKY